MAETRSRRPGADKKPRIGRWPDSPQDWNGWRWHEWRRGWYAMFPDTPDAYTPCDSWPEALMVVAKWYAQRDVKDA